MFYPRYYHCNECDKNFTTSDGVIHLPSSGVECPYCGSKKTRERIAGGLIDGIKSLLGK